MLFKDDKNLQNNVDTLQIKIGNQTVEQVGTGCKEKYFKFVGPVLLCYVDLIDATDVCT